jgi:hypothetical protein
MTLKVLVLDSYRVPFLHTIRAYLGQWHSFLFTPHCTKKPIYVFPDMKLCGLIPNSYIYVSVSDFYIPRIGLPLWRQQNRQTDPGNM